MNRLSKLMCWIGIIAIVILLFASCSTEKKAVRQMNNGIERYEDTARKLFRKAFPCITTGVDSSQYLESIKRMDVLLQAVTRSAKASEKRLQFVRDSAKLAMSQYDCPELLNQAADHIAGLQVQNEELQDDTSRLKADLRKVRAALNNIKPVIREIKDSSEIKDAIVALWRVTADRDYWKFRAYEEQDWRVKMQNKMAGTLPIYIPWWLIVAAGILFGMSIAARIKTGLFNPLKLFTKTRNMKSIIFLLIASVTMLTGCGKFHGTNQSIWSEGMWIIPWGLGLAAAFSLYRAWVASKQPSERQLPGGGYKYYREGIPFWKTTPFKFFIGFILALIGVIIWQNLEK